VKEGGSEADLPMSQGAPSDEDPQAVIVRRVPRDWEETRKRLEAVAARMPGPQIDHVRLNVDARAL